MLTITSSAVVPNARFSTRTQVLPLAAPMILTLPTDLIGLRISGRTSFRPRAALNKLLLPGSSTTFTNPLPFRVGNSSTPTFGLVVLMGSCGAYPCSLGDDEEVGRSSFPCPPDIRFKRDGRDLLDWVGDKRDARVCWTVLWRSCFQSPTSDFFPGRYRLVSSDTSSERLTILRKALREPFVRE